MILTGSCISIFFFLCVNLLYISKSLLTASQSEDMEVNRDPHLHMNTKTVEKTMLQVFIYLGLVYIPVTAPSSQKLIQHIGIY